MTCRVSVELFVFYQSMPAYELQSKVLVPRLLVSGACFKLVSAIKVL
jgi:hypothetical protein